MWICKGKSSTKDALARDYRKHLVLPKNTLDISKNHKQFLATVTHKLDIIEQLCELVYNQRQKNYKLIMFHCCDKQKSNLVDQCY